MGCHAHHSLTGHNTITHHLVKGKHAPHDSNHEYPTGWSQSQKDPFPQQLTQTQNTEQQQIIRRCCEKPRIVNKACRKHNRKEQERQGEKQTVEKPNVKTYPPYPHCRGTNHSADMCWNNPNAANTHKRYKTENPIDSTDGSHKP